LNEAQAFDFGITAVDDVTLRYKTKNPLNPSSKGDNTEQKELVVNADLTNDLVDF